MHADWPKPRQNATRLPSGDTLMRDELGEKNPISAAVSVSSALTTCTTAATRSQNVKSHFGSKTIFTLSKASSHRHARHISRIGPSFKDTRMSPPFGCRRTSDSPATFSISTGS